MSQLKSVSDLEKQLTDLRMTKDYSGRIKKIPPAVPPKKKAQPQVPQCAIVSTVCEPSYSMKMSPVINNSPMYSNLSSKNMLPMVHKNHMDFNKINFSNHPNLPQQTMPLTPNIQRPYNLLPHRNVDDSLPAPPPPPFHLPSNSYSFTNKEEYLPPPSPVSSNYSELVQATSNMNFNHDRPTYPIYQNEYPEYGQESQASNYESLYEPINPHTMNNQSVINNNSFQSLHNPGSSKSPLAKEEEVDTLTNLLVQSISDSQDLDVFGVCIKCNQKVVGESSGCTAMGKIYHVQCFCCHYCNLNLQGKPFYAVEGQPYCEEDYYETLEKCSVCNKPILDRILRATGKPYHPTCFTCVVCDKSLDGIPFTVDAMNQIHCIDDFHKKFAPRCCVCELPIMPEDGEEETVRVVALDRSFHVRCYRCEDCGLLLSSEAEGRGCYPLDNHILCKNCNAHRIRLLTNVMTTDL